jgi:uncharacterized protein YjbI with pentapeptide repeats
MPDCAYIHTDKTNGQKTPCRHQAYGRKRFCVFHSEDVRAKTPDFEKAFTELLIQATSSSEPVDLDFKGFVFPRVDFRGYVFRGIADFREARFEQDVDFRGATFLQQADFHTTEFSKGAGFFAVVFASNTRFLGAIFDGRAIFNGAKFRGSTAFHGCKFADFAAWQGSKFDRPVVFQSNEFIRDADFRQATFFHGVNFYQTLFRGRVDFECTRFHGEVLFTETHIKFLKKLSCRHANMDGAVLHTAQIWENERLSYYSFRGAFLISVNLAGKEITDCDFTGAVFKAVLTVGWKVDRQTRMNTKFIYTDYRSSEVQMADGSKRRIYSPVPESRVPAEGKFGEGEHSNFTFADYLREPLRMNVALSVPPLLRTAVTNYLQLFTDFLQVTQGIPVELRTRLEGSKLRVEFLAQTEEDLEAIRQSFDDYQRSAGRNFEELKLHIAFRKEITALERELFLMKMETQINHLRTELTYTKALLEKTEENRDLLARIVESSRSPRLLFEPWKIPAQARPYQSEISVLHADLANFSGAVQAKDAPRTALQSLLAELQSEIQAQTPCSRIKAQGGGFMIFSTDSLWLFEVAQQLGSKLDHFKLRNPSSLGSFRCVLNRGRVNCVVVDGLEDFEGDMVIECVRVDQPMKGYLQQQGLAGNRVWCIESFKADIETRSSHLRFAPLPPMALDKGYEGNSKLFEVTVA